MAYKGDLALILQIKNSYPEEKKINMMTASQFTERRRRFIRQTCC
jgi:hypothetical protein